VLLEANRIVGMQFFSQETFIGLSELGTLVRHCCIRAAVRSSHLFPNQQEDCSQWPSFFLFTAMLPNQRVNHPPRKCNPFWHCGRIGLSSLVQKSSTEEMVSCRQAAFETQRRSGQRWMHFGVDNWIGELSLPSFRSRRAPRTLSSSAFHFRTKWVINRFDFYFCVAIMVSRWSRALHLHCER